jgi:hypothetical protein
MSRATSVALRPVTYACAQARSLTQGELQFVIHSGLRRTRPQGSDFGPIENQRNGRRISAEQLYAHLAQPIGSSHATPITNRREQLLLDRRYAAQPSARSARLHHNRG